MIDNKEEKKSIVLAVTITVLCSKNCLFILPFIAGLIPAINVVVSVVVLLLFAYDLKYIFSAAGIQVITFTFAFLFCFIIQLAIFPQNSSILREDLITIIFYGAIPFQMAVSIKDYDCFLFYLRKAALFIVCISVFCAVFYLTSSMNIGYSMSFSNSAVVGVAVLEVFAFNTKRKSDIILSILGIIVIAACGSRGALLPIAVITILYPLLFKKGTKARKLGVFIGTSAVITILYYLYDFLLNNITEFLAENGISNRNIYMLNEGYFFTIGEGRQSIYSKCIELSNEHPALGIGYGGLDGLGYHNWTPHNMYLEAILYYGYFFGGIIIVSLVFLWIHGVFYRGNRPLQTTNFIFFALYVPRTFFGAGMVTNICFWLLLAVAISSINNHYYGYKLSHNDRSFRLSEGKGVNKWIDL